MLRSSGGRRPAVLIILGLLIVFPTLIPWGAAHAASESFEQAEPVITHDGVDCVVTLKHAIIRAVIRPANEIRVVRVYFRSALYPEFYFVEATRNGDRFEAVIPRPKAETKRIVYYIEAVTHDFATARTNNFEPQVTDDETACKDEDAVPPYYVGSDPNIIVGITQAGVPAIPPGFEAIGLAGRNFPTTPILIGAGAAGAAAVILAAGGDDENPTTSIPSGGSTTTAAVTTSTPGTTTTTAPAGEGPIACFTTNPDPPRVRTGDVIRFDADCSRPSESGAGTITSYQWDFGDGGSREGRFVQRTFDRAGTYTVTLRVTNQAGQTDTESRNVVVEESPVTTTTTSTVPNQADVSISKSGPGSVALNTNFTYTVTVDNGGPKDASNVVINDVLPGGLTLVGATFVPASAGTCTLNFGVPSVSCTAPSLANGSSKTVTITVRTANPGTYLNQATVTVGSPPDPNLGNNTSNTVSTGAALTALDELAYLGSSFVSAVEVSSEAKIQGQVVINGQQIDSVAGSSRFAHVFRGPIGENVVEAYITTGDVQEGIWRFDFREAAHFAPGSIVVDSGQVVALGPREVVFRVTGTSGPRIRFRYRLEL